MTFGGGTGCPIADWFMALIGVIASTNHWRVIGQRHGRAGNVKNDCVIHKARGSIAGHFVLFCN